MTSLTRAKNGDWFARKGIPQALRESYKAAYGVSQEERFRRPASLSMGQAKQELRDWDAEVTARIERLRAHGTGSGLELSFREMLALAGAWFERDMMLERQREGIAKAKAEGRYKGRAPTARSKAAEVTALAADGMSMGDIAKRLGIGKGSVHRILKGAATGAEAA